MTEPDNQIRGLTFQQTETSNSSNKEMQERWNIPRTTDNVKVNAKTIMKTTDEDGKNKNKNSYQATTHSNQQQVQLELQDKQQHQNHMNKKDTLTNLENRNNSRT